MPGMRYIHQISGWQGIMGRMKRHGSLAYELKIRHDHEQQFQATFKSSLKSHPQQSEKMLSLYPLQ